MAFRRKMTKHFAYLSNIKNATTLDFHVIIQAGARYFSPAKAASAFDFAEMARTRTFVKKAPFLRHEFFFTFPASWATIESIYFGALAW